MVTLLSLKCLDSEFSSMMREAPCGWLQSAYAATVSSGVKAASASNEWLTRTIFASGCADRYRKHDDDQRRKATAIVRP